MERENWADDVLAERDLNLPESESDPLAAAWKRRDAAEQRLAEAQAEMDEAVAEIDRLQKEGV